MPVSDKTSAAATKPSAAGAPRTRRALGDITNATSSTNSGAGGEKGSVKGEKKSSSTVVNATLATTSNPSSTAMSVSVGDRDYMSRPCDDIDARDSGK